jgi:hypothetical protein
LAVGKRRSGEAKEKGRENLREKIHPGVDFFINFDHNNILEENEND